MRPKPQASRRLKLQHLNVLLAVAKAGSMAKAAKQLAISQPVVSRTIANLEHTLGVRLFDRSPVGVEPTLYGRALLKRGVAIFDDLNASVGDIELLADPTAGEVRIGASDAQFGFVSAIVERLLQQHPRMTFMVTHGGATALIEHDLRERKIDLVVGPLPARASEHELETTLVYDCFLSVVASKQSHWARYSKLTLADLVGEPWCGPWPDAHEGIFANIFRSQGLAIPRTILTCSSDQLRMRLIADGRFVCMVGQAILQFNPMPPWLHVLPIDVSTPRWPVGIITLKNRTISPVAQRFIDAAREVATPLATRRVVGR